MNKVVIIPHDVISQTNLPEMSVDFIPTDGDPLEINKELYFVCEQNYTQQSDQQLVGVIPLVVRNPQKVLNIKNYIKCLTIAHRKVQFRNDKGICDFEYCDEMITS
jgi:hypothetical protein